MVLDRLPLITKPDGPAAARRLRAMAFLGPLVALYTGRHRQNVDARTGGLKQLSGRLRIQVSLIKTFVRAPTQLHFSLKDCLQGHR